MSPKHKRFTADEIVKILKNNNFKLTSQKGSHQKWKNHYTGNQVIVPFHKKSQQLPIGTIKSIIIGSGIDKENWK